MFDSLGCETVGFAPESELHVSRSVLAGFAGGGFVGDPIGRRGPGGLAAVS
jgi:hypothetical protein